MKDGLKMNDVLTQTLASTAHARTRVRTHTVTVA